MLTKKIAKLEIKKRKLFYFSHKSNIIFRYINCYMLFATVQVQKKYVVTLNTEVQYMLLLLYGTALFSCVFVF